MDKLILMQWYWNCVFDSPILVRFRFESAELGLYSHFFGANKCYKMSAVAITLLAGGPYCLPCVCVFKLERPFLVPNIEKR